MVLGLDIADTGQRFECRRWDLLDRVVDAGTPPVRRTTFTYGTERVAITNAPSTTSG